MARPGRGGSNGTFVRCLRQVSGDRPPGEPRSQRLGAYVVPERAAPARRGRQDPPAHARLHAVPALRAHREGGIPADRRNERLTVSHQPLHEITAMASISTRAPRGSADTWTVDRAGRLAEKYRPYTSFIASKSPILVR